MDPRTTVEPGFLKEAVSRVEHFEPHQAIGHVLRSRDECAFLLEGLAFSHVLLQNGTRQITALHFPGEFCDLRHLLLRSPDELTAVTSAQVAFASRRRIQDLSQHRTSVALCLLQATLSNEAVSKAWLTAMGRQSASSRLARLLCEICVRYCRAGLSDGRSFPMPLTQTELADALGISSVHVNRVLQKLRNDGLLALSRHVITIGDWDLLARHGEFDSGYLEADWIAPDGNDSAFHSRSASHPDPANLPVD